MFKNGFLHRKIIPDHLRILIDDCEKRRHKNDPLFMILQGMCHGIPEDRKRLTAAGRDIQPVDPRLLFCECPALIRNKFPYTIDRRFMIKTCDLIFQEPEIFLPQTRDISICIPSCKFRSIPSVPIHDCGSHHAYEYCRHCHRITFLLKIVPGTGVSECSFFG